MSEKPGGSQGSAGAIRDAGGAFAKMEIAHEEGKGHHKKEDS